MYREREGSNIMSEENKFENNQEPENETVPVQEETAETSETAEAPETVGAEETAQAETAEAVGVEGTEKAVSEEELAAQAAAKKSKRTVIGVVIAAVVVVAAAVLFIMFKNTLFNPYIKDYVDVNGMTVGETADLYGMEYSDFLEYFDLPKDMPKSTPQQAAVYAMPAGRYAEAIVGWDFESMKEQLQWGDDITEETPIGDAFDQTTIGNYVGEDRFEEFKSTFGLDDSITKDTLWKEVRNIVDTKQKEEYEAEQAGITEAPAEESTEAAAEESTEAAAATEAAVTEAAAE